MMYVHEQIIEAVGKIQREHDMTKAGTVAEMGQAIHIMLTFNEQDIGSILNTIRPVSCASARERKSP